MKISKDEVESLDLIFRSSEFYKNNSQNQENNKDTKDTKYTTTYNLVYIIIAIGTPLLLFFGAIMLLLYLNSINSNNLFIENISTLTFINLVSFYGLTNIFTYIVIILPSLYIILVHTEKPEEIRNHKTLTYASLIPILFTPITLIIFITPFGKYISNNIEAYFLAYFFIYLYFNHKEWLIKENREACDRLFSRIIFDRLFYSILFWLITSSFSFLILTSDINNNEMIVYIVNLFLFVIISLSFNITTIKEIRNGKNLIKNYLLGFMVFLILNPMIPEIVNAFKSEKKDSIDYTYTYKTMKAMGYADKKDKIYFISKNLIDSKIIAEPFLVQSSHEKEDIYKPYCGKIYFRTSEIIVFKLKDKTQKVDFKQIPRENIFELQERSNDYCRNDVLSNFSNYYSRFINTEKFKYIINKTEYSSESFNRLKFDF
ncbi:hypothetical protein [Mannheimia pernigra]|uniref:hypothetical protein n=1 Tax=Mannheimia pernigra TaxID=111844 RepID=UPI001317D789|nr:hypothetical protein [Mannheimia pernigra]QHB16805.1 hypothetical protein GM695_01385 [Mannheimia pernigra]